MTLLSDSSRLNDCMTERQDCLQLPDCKRCASRDEARLKNRGLIIPRRQVNVHDAVRWEVLSLKQNRISAGDQD